MKLPKSKRMRNNASSVIKEKDIRNMISRNGEESNESKLLLSKHIQLRNSFLKANPSAVFQTSDQVLGNGEKHLIPNLNMSAPTITYCHQFTNNSDIDKLFSKSNFPKRYPTKFDDDHLAAPIAVQDENENLVAVATSESNMTKIFIKFWNRFIEKQDSSTYSKYDHRLFEEEACYLPCQMKNVLNAPESYLKREYCHKSRYVGHGHQFLPAGNQFLKISSRSQATLELKQIFDYYSNGTNQYYLIPIELSSKLSRCLNRNIDISRQSQACNKIRFSFKPKTNNLEEVHPLFLIEYKPSIELEILPSSCMSLINISVQSNPSDVLFKNLSLQKAIFSYPYLSHFLKRSDAWVDDFYARCWHFSRFFADKLDLGGRINSMTEILAKDSFFKFLVACSAKICMAVKYWIMNPEGATYFRCWCGQKVYDSKQESKTLGKLGIGSSELYNLQQKIRTQDSFHNKHGERKSSSHICACNQHFSEHKTWMAHIFSPKLSDATKICPIFIYNFAQQSTCDNHYICECDASFSDYDFWSFWLHACGCNVLKSSIKSSCRCNPNNKTYKTVGSCKHLRKSRTPRRNKVTMSLRSRSRSSGHHSAGKSVLEDPERDFANQSDSFEADTISKIDKSAPLMKERNDASEDNWKSGDNVALPLKVTKQSNFNS